MVPSLLRLIWEPQNKLKVFNFLFFANFLKIVQKIKSDTLIFAWKRSIEDELEAGARNLLSFFEVHQAKVSSDEEGNEVKEHKKSSAGTKSNMDSFLLDFKSFSHRTLDNTDIINDTDSVWQAFMGFIVFYWQPNIFCVFVWHLTNYPFRFYCSFELLVDFRDKDIAHCVMSFHIRKLLTGQQEVLANHA